MTLVIGAWSVGLLLALLALGVFISFRVFSFPDITADGSFTLGASVTALGLVTKLDPFLASTCGFLAGMAAGATTAVLHTKFKIHGLLAGILVMTALYSVNLRVMGKSNVPLMHERTLVTWAEGIGGVVHGWFRRAGDSAAADGEMQMVFVFGWEVAVRDLSVLAFGLFAVVATAAVLYTFFRTHLGTAMRATGDNPQMIRAQGASTDAMMIMGLAVSNGLIALSGSLFAQYQGFSDVQMGVGMVVRGLAAVIIGEALVGGGWLGLTIAGAILGSILFNLLIAIALRVGLDPNDLKLVQAVFVFVALTLPTLVGRFRIGRAARG